MRLVKISIVVMGFLLLSACGIFHKTSIEQPAINISELKPGYVVTPSGRIEYYQFGNGSPVVFIAGFATDVTSWNKKFLTEIAKDHQVIVFNNRGVGGSVVRTKKYLPRDLADDTYLLVSKLHLSQPTIVGISMGGMIAQEYAIRYPHAIGHLVLINTSIAGKKAVYPDRRTQQRLRHLPQNKIGFYLTAVDLFFPESTRPHMAYSLAADRFLPKSRHEVDAASVMRPQRALVDNWLHDDSAANQLRYIKIPVLVMSGASDAVIPPANSDILAKTIPHANLMRWKSGGHAMIYQYPQQMGEVINQFISKTSVKE